MPSPDLESPDRGPRPRPSEVARRFVPDGGLKLHRRDADGVDGPATLVGHAAVFDQWTTLYEGKYFTWREIIRPGAFRRAIAKRQDVRSLFNHRADFVLGRTSSGTLRLSEDAVGLLSETDPPDTQLVRDLVLTPVSRGDVSGMSFAFLVPRSTETVTTKLDGVTVIDDGKQRITIRREGDREFEEVELLDLDLIDVSPVTYPAYPQTDLGLRSLGEQRERAIEIQRRDSLPRPSRRCRAERLQRLAEAD